MTHTNFDEALRRVLSHEGGYTNNAADPGGPTNFGITIGDYRRYVKADATAGDVRAMRLEDAEGIYRQRYWDVMRCDDFPAGIDYAVFDYAVNSGVGRAGKVLRRLLGLPSTTSVIDSAIVEAAVAGDPRNLIAALCDERLAFLQSLKTWPVFGVGWSRRVAEVRSVSLAMANAAGKGKAAPSPNTTTKAIVAGTATLATGVAAHQTSGMPFLAVIAIVAMAGIAICAVWLVWRRLQHRQEV